MKALRSGSKVGVTIDSNEWPCKVLQIRGTVRVETMEGVSEEYASLAGRYIGEEQEQEFASNSASGFPITIASLSNHSG